jgi:hypothetical protein
MAKAWWLREQPTLEQCKPDFITSLNAPLMRPTQLMEAIVRYHHMGVTFSALGRELGMPVATLYSYASAKVKPGDKGLTKASWLFRALDAKELKFVKVPRSQGKGPPLWLLVKGDTPENALVAKPTIGICACGRYQSCPCGRFEGRTHADSNVAVQQKRVRKRVGHRKRRSKVPKVPL